MIKIEFKKKPASYTPGQPIQGRVSWSELPMPNESIELRLVWYTKGKGDRDLSVAETKPIRTLDASGETEFEFTAPGYPYTFSGKLISLVWAVEAVSKSDRHSDSSEIVISPSGEEVMLYSDEAPS